jgi:hypothetical protein
MHSLLHSSPRNLKPLLLALALATFAHAGDFPKDPLGWPAVTSTQKPWTRWWWLGSAVDRPNLTRELEDFAKAGLGGVEICPIYGAKGVEDRFLKFLSPGWMEMLGHTTSEAKRLGLGVDLTTGTGWPFGGPMVTPEMASADMQLIRHTPQAGKATDLVFKGSPQCLRAYPDVGEALDLMEFIEDGKLVWTPPAGNWRILGLASASPIQKVKRAAPGGEGSVLDPFSAAAMSQYLTAFDRALEKFPGVTPRAHFHDSFEYYGAEWTPAFLADFKTARGYDLRDQLPAFAGIGDADTVARVRSDYRETLDELHLGYLKSWHDWAKKRGCVTRNQAHGSPGNLLDQYAVSEIPETEIFRHVDEDQIPMLRFAASAAHSNGGTLVSSESFTWLDEHFQVTPDKLKEAADFVFLGGVNHVFFHGIPHSPANATWPGWLFYASTHMGPNGGLWRDLPEFTAYLRRCQSILQEGRFTADVLLYHPIHDLWKNGEEKLPLFTIHNQNEWLWPTTFYGTAMDLWKNGITFDYTSERMLANATVRDGEILLGGNAFSALVLPGVERMRPATLQRILELTGEGATVIVQGGWPEDVPGFHQLDEQRAALHALPSNTNNNVIQCQGSIIPSLVGRGVLQEPMAALGLRFVRRSHAEGYHYFIVNRSGKPFDGIVPLAVPFECAVILDPWSDTRNGLATGKNGIALHLEPGESIIVRTFTDKKIDTKPWVSFPTNTANRPINGPWKIQFTEGGPVLPKSSASTTLGSWTHLSDPDVANFSGTAAYSTRFDFDGRAESTAWLDLGKVAETARVYLNDRFVGISWHSPHRIDVGGFLVSGENLLRIEVTNLAANRIADLDRRKVEWKQFHEINFVNIDYKLFDASTWPTLESGLIGPVRLLIPAPRKDK